MLDAVHHFLHAVTLPQCLAFQRRQNRHLADEVFLPCRHDIAIDAVVDDVFIFVTVLVHVWRRRRIEKNASRGDVCKCVLAVFVRGIPVRRPETVAGEHEFVYDEQLSDQNDRARDRGAHPRNIATVLKGPGDYVRVCSNVADVSKVSASERPDTQTATGIVHNFPPASFFVASVYQREKVDRQGDVVVVSIVTQASKVRQRSHDGTVCAFFICAYRNSRV